jgi:large subunit ribosomal protein L12
MEYIYGALLLHKLGKPVDEAHLKKLIEASGAEIDEAKLKSVVVSLKDVDINKELESATLVSASSASSEKVEEKKEEKEEVKPEEAAEGLASLFG